MEKQHEFESYPKVPELCGFKIDAYARCGLVASADIHDVGEGNPTRSANSNLEAAIKREEEEETGTLVNEEKNQSGVASRNEKQLTGVVARRPAETFHVMDFIREEMDERDWSIWTLVRHMSEDQSNQALSRVKLALEFLALRDPQMLIGEEVATGLGRAFGTSAQIWLNLDRSWQDASTLVTESSEASDTRDDTLRGQASNPKSSSSTSIDSRLSVDEKQLFQAVLRVIDDGCNCFNEKHPWEFYGDESGAPDAFTEEEANANRLRFADAIIDTYRKFLKEQG